MIFASFYILSYPISCFSSQFFTSLFSYVLLSLIWFYTFCILLFLLLSSTYSLFFCFSKKIFVLFFHLFLLYFVKNFGIFSALIFSYLLLYFNYLIFVLLSCLCTLLCDFAVFFCYVFLTISFTEKCLG